MFIGMCVSEGDVWEIVAAVLFLAWGNGGIEACEGSFLVFSFEMDVVLHKIWFRGEIGFKKG